MRQGRPGHPIDLILIPGPLELLHITLFSADSVLGALVELRVYPAAGGFPVIFVMYRPVFVIETKLSVNDLTVLNREANFADGTVLFGLRAARVLPVRQR